MLHRRCVWANRAFFSSALLTPASDAPQRLEMPLASNEADGLDEQSEEDETERIEGGEDDDDDGDEDDEEDDEEEREAARLLAREDVPQMATCITLSSLPTAHVRTLRHLDTIQQRNLPKAPPKAPERAPFFLPTTAGVEREFVAPAPAAAAPTRVQGTPAEQPMAGWPADGADDDEWAAAAAAAGADATVELDVAPSGPEEGANKRARTSRLLSSGGLPQATILQQLLHAADTEAAASKAASSAGRERSAAADAALMAHMVSLSPSALDVEIRGLGGGGLLKRLEDDARAELPAELRELRAALNFFARQAEAGRDFELAQAALELLLRAHQETLSSAVELAPALEAVRDAHGAAWGKLRDELHANLCLLSFLCRTRT